MESEMTKLWKGLRDMGYGTGSNGPGFIATDATVPNLALRTVKSLKESNDELREELVELRSKVIDLEMGWAHHDCSEALDVPQPVLTDLSDDTVSVADRVICYVQMYRDRGDPSVGIQDTAFLAVAETEKETWFKQVTGGVDVEVPDDVHELAIRILARRCVQGAKEQDRDMKGEPDLAGEQPGKTPEELLAEIENYLYEFDRCDEGYSKDVLGVCHELLGVRGPDA